MCKSAVQKCEVADVHEVPAKSRTISTATGWPLFIYLPQSSANKWNHKLVSRDILICGMTELPRLES